MMDIAYNFHSKYIFTRPVFFFFPVGEGIWFCLLEDVAFPESGVKEEKIVETALSKNVSDTVVEKFNANFGTRGFFRIIDFI